MTQAVAATNYESATSNANPTHLVSIQDRAVGEEELMNRGQVNDTPAFIRQPNGSQYHHTHDSTPRHHHNRHSQGLSLNKQPHSTESKHEYLAVNPSPYQSASHSAPPPLYH